MPRTSVPFMSSPRASSACAETNGAAPTTCGCWRASGQRALHVGHGRAAGRKNLDVRDHAEHAVAHFFLKTVHHRQHDDERRHPERDAQHGHARDERK
jgi:hypothetical protein